ncbi:MAG: hypothetical protein LBG93_04470 [Treponema sp.]|jgi:flagellar basal body-associated protein FliL|nr:hypothetical protein [Treponema sp.]
MGNQKKKRTLKWIAAITWFVIVLLLMAGGIWWMFSLRDPVMLEEFERRIANARNPSFGVCGGQHHTRRIPQRLVSIWRYCVVSHFGGNFKKENKYLC